MKAKSEIEFDNMDINTKSLDDLSILVLKWAEERNLINGSNSKSQMIKLMEEMGELSSALAKGKKEETIDSIGDMMVVLTIIANQEGTSLSECYENAWNEIKDRKGKMIDGIFVKDE